MIDKNTSDMIILVDKNDREIGYEEKMKPHLGGRLHRAFSIFVFNSDGKMLLQQRAKSKYHSGGLWTNACCSHPRKGEETDEAAHRRLSEEMGFDCPLEEQFTFIYKAKLDGGRTEHELDHVFTGAYNGEVKPDPEEADGYDWISIDNLKKDMKLNPDKYTVWFKIALPKVLENL
jgi:isopentenyl-diphosphate delta-isomerase